MTQPAAGGTGRTTPTVFDRLRKSEQGGLGGTDEQDLQYPNDLGTDEYNQFVLFTVYEKENTTVQAEQREKALQQQRNAELDNPGDINRIAEILRAAKADNPIEAGKNLLSALADAGITLTNSVADKVSQYLGDGTETGEQIAESARSQAFAQELVKMNNDSPSNADIFLNRSATSSVKNAVNDGLDIKARSRDRIRLGRTRLDAAKHKAKTNISLYLPNKLVNNGTLTYENVSFELLQGVNAAVSGEFGALLGMGKRKLAEFVDGVAGIAGVNPNIAPALTAVTGLAINPRQEQVFNGVETRTFDFNFSLAPMSRKEAVEISNIVRAFRKYSHPSVRTGSAFLSIPAEFEIKYYKIHDDGIALENLFLNRIERCALTNVNVDFTPNGVKAFFEDGSPVRTNIQLSFTELRPLTREDVEEGF